LLFETEAQQTPKNRNLPNREIRFQPLKTTKTTCYALYNLNLLNAENSNSQQQEEIM
jgi:hypothetical protein